MKLETTDVTIQDANLRIDNKQEPHKIGISGNPSEEMASSLIFRAVFDSTSDYKFILGDGKFFLGIRSVKIKSDRHWFIYSL